MTSIYSSPACILLTGVTGFLGKVVLEELFRRSEEIHLDKVIIITRHKKGEDPKSRFLKEIVSSPCFANLPKNWHESVQVVEGDLTLPNCGIHENVLEKIYGEITHIIHCAGCVQFDSPIAEAINANVTTSFHMCEFARNCSKHRQLTTTSTAYVQPHIEGPIYEELVKLPCDAISLLDGIESGQITEEDALEITGHPNTYTLTKCLAEHIIMGYETVLPLAIVRPSIISASRCFPVPGWIDSHAAFAGFIAAFGLGILHVVDGNVNGRGDIVPVDDVARQLIDTTLKLGNVSKDSRIVYAVAGWRNSVPWRTSVSTITEFFNGKPPSPGGKAKLNYFGPRNLMYHFHDIVRQKIPFAVSKWYFGVVGDTKMRSKTAKIANLVESINKVFPYFVHHSFDFRPRNDLLGNSNCENYVRLVCTGVERYLLRKGEKL